LHPDDIQTVFQHEGKYPIGILSATGSWALKAFERVYYGENKLTLIDTDGENWKRLRTTLQKDMFSPKDAVEYLPLTHKCATEAVEAFPKWVNSDKHEIYYPIVSFDML